MENYSEVCNLPYSGKPITSRMILSLMDSLELSVSGVEGYHLSTDRCSSVQLAEELDNQKCHTTGTIIAGRVGTPKPVRKGARKKMKSGDTFAYRRRNILLMGWKCKSVVLMSAYHDTSMEKIVTVQKEGAAERNSKVNVCI
jgi:hypothetical protein